MSWSALHSFLRARVGIGRFLLLLLYLIGEAVRDKHYSGRDQPDGDS
jgi:hypothetical protein